MHKSQEKVFKANSKQLKQLHNEIFSKATRNSSVLYYNE